MTADYDIPKEIYIDGVKCKVVPQDRDIPLSGLWIIQREGHRYSWLGEADGFYAWRKLKRQASPCTHYEIGRLQRHASIKEKR